MRRSEEPMSILDKAISEEKRAEFLQYRLSKHRDTPEEYEQMRMLDSTVYI